MLMRRQANAKLMLWASVVANANAKLMLWVSVVAKLWASVVQGGDAHDSLREGPNAVGPAWLPS